MWIGVSDIMKSYTETDNVVFKSGPMDGKFMVVKRGIESVRFLRFDGSEIRYYRTDKIEDGNVIFE